ncbi:hypothetical protein ABZX74_06320 [Streptomyces olivaceoviridis]|uniref:hypothetical protein n=1 Tax=Streptomyces olivaceoviridis TaxID=1921 RepID=UPI0033BE7F7B
MTDAEGSGAVGSGAAAQELRDRVEAAAAGTPYRLQGTAQGFDLTVDVRTPQWRELLTRHRIGQVHTYRVALRPQQKRFTLTDVVRTVEYEAGPGGVRLGRTVSVGRSVYVTRTWSPGGTPEHSFNSTEGHRLIRGAARELGWQEVRPTSVKIAMGFGILGGVVALGTLVALAAVFWL